MEFRQLRYMLTLGELRNMTKAADTLYVSQSALSHYLKNVENELGTALFDRSTNPMSLTYAGKCYMESARKILMENDRLLKELRDITHHLTGTLTLGTSRDRASYMLPRILPKFSAAYPGIKLNLFTASMQKLMEALRSGKVDFVLLPNINISSEKDLTSEPVYKEELLLASGVGYLPDSAEISPGVVRSKSLSELPFYLLFQEHAIRIWCDSWFKKKRLKIQPVMEFSSNIACYRMAASGMGVTIIPYLTTQLALPGAEAKLYSLAETPVTWDVHLIYRRNAFLGQPELDLIRIIEKEFSNEQLRSLEDLH